VEKLKELGLLVKEEPYENNVGFSERADVPIEPRLIRAMVFEISEHKTPTCSTPGSARGCGRLRRWAGRSRPTR
jgi:valyl-tRNA synthetase